MAEKMSGMEMMLASALRAAGFDPVAIKANIEQFVGSLVSSIQGLHSKADNNAIVQAEILARLKRIEAKMDIPAELDDNAGSNLRLVSTGKTN
jgi:hypothetical protein